MRENIHFYTDKDMDNIANRYFQKLVRRNYVIFQNVELKRLKAGMCFL